MYRSLDASKILETVERLARRVEERFPNASLTGVSSELSRIARESAATVEELRRPNLALRIGVWVLVAGFAAVLVLLAQQLGLTWQIRAGTELIQTLDALLEALFFIGGGILFLVTLEGRLKRRRVLAAIHELRALAHIVDMHQLTKDPEQLLNQLPRTASSPERTMSDVELQRYLDYSTELLSLIGKISALYVQGFADPVVLAAVDEVEDLTTGLSRKIWQKISMLEQLVARSHEEALARRAPRPFGAGTSGAKQRARAAGAAARKR